MVSFKRCNILNQKEAMKKSCTFLLEYDKIAEILIRNSADVKVVGQDNYTGLHWAAEHGMEKSVDLAVK